MTKGQGACLCCGEPQRDGTVPAGIGDAQGSLPNVHTRLMGGFQEDGARLLLEVSLGRTSGDGLQLKHQRLCLNIPILFFTVRVSKHSPSLAREVVASLSLETCTKCLGMVLGALAGGGSMRRCPARTPPTMVRL